MAVDEVDSDKLEQMKSVWTTEMQVSLFHAMHDHKPVGISRFFQMAFIRDKVNSSNNKKVTCREIWNYLGTLYDVNALNDSERLHILDKEVDFELPSDMSGFKELMAADYPRTSSSKSSCQISTSSSSSSLCEKVSETPEKKDAEPKQEIVQSEEITKSEQRKRTRQGNHGGGNDSGTPHSSKRRRI